MKTNQDINDMNDRLTRLEDKVDTLVHMDQFNQFRVEMIDMIKVIQSDHNTFIPRGTFFWVIGATISAFITITGFVWSFNQGKFSDNEHKFKAIQEQYQKILSNQTKIQTILEFSDISSFK